MFEKEAEEYANGKGHEHYNYLFEENARTPATFANWCFKDGAEFGYNFAKEEIDYLNKHWGNGKDKVNEWHKVDDKLPTHGNFVCNQDGYPCQYDVVTRQWLDIVGTQIKTTEWCELPYKESE